MTERGTSSTTKRILFISLFIVPFLIGMALIFMGKGLGTLPTLHKESKGIFYTLPEFQATNFADSSNYTFSHLDSSIFVVILMPKELKSEWGKHIMYASKIFERYNNTKILTVFEEGKSKVWDESPLAFFERYPKWEAVTQDSLLFKETMGLFKTTKDSITGVPPYIIVDKEKHIRAYCDINDLKKVRDVPKMLKILNNQYAPRKIEVTRKTTN